VAKRRNDLSAIKPIKAKEETTQKRRRTADTVIGIVLLILIITGSGILLWRSQKTATPQVLGASTENTDALKAEIANLNQKIDDLNKKLDTVASTPVTETTSTQTVSANTSDSTAVVSGKININTASSSQLDTLPGIGPTYAQRIIDYRQTHGGFKSIDEIKNVKGIGDKTFEKFRDMITI